jgi:hypothetical protein
VADICILCVLYLEVFLSMGSKGWLEDAHIRVFSEIAFGYDRRTSGVGSLGGYLPTDITWGYFM